MPRRASVSSKDSRRDDSGSRLASEADDDDNDVASNPFANPFFRGNQSKGGKPSSATKTTPQQSGDAAARRRQAEAEEEAGRRLTRGGTTARRSHESSDEEEEEEEEEDHEFDEDEEDEDEEEFEDEDEYVDELPAETVKKYRQPKLRFDLSTFGGEFDAASFISDLTRDLFDQQGDDGDFDPAPFSLLFDNALIRLNALRDETDARILQYAAQCKRDEEAHRENLAGTQEQLAAILTQFGRLDTRISSVAHTAVRIGHTLQAVDAAKRANLQGQEIIAHFLAFNEGIREKLPPIFNTTDPAELHRAAGLIQMLSAISQDLRVKGTEKATALIARTSNDIENQLIARFDAAYARDDLDEMKACAETLLNFRGKSVITRYVFSVVAKLETYASKDTANAASANSKYAADDDDDDGPSGSPTGRTHRMRGANQSIDTTGFAAALAQYEAAEDRTTLVGAFRLRLLRFYRGVMRCMNEQVHLCRQVFPQPLAVLKAILERIFQDKIAGLIDSGLSERRLSTEEYLKCLEFAHKHTLELVQGLQQAIRSMPGGGAAVNSRESRAFGSAPSTPMGLVAIGGGNPSNAGIMAYPLSASPSPAATRSGQPSGEQVSMMNLGDQVNGLFAAYRETYFAHEMALVTQACQRNIQECLTIEPPRARTTSQADSAGGGSPGESETDFLGRLKKTVVQDQKQKWVLATLEYPLVDRLIQCSVASLERCDKLSEPNQVPDHTSTIFLHVASAIFETYLQPILDVALEYGLSQSSDAKTEPDTFFFQVVGLTNLVVDKLMLHHAHWVSTRVASSANTQVICATRLRELTQRVEAQLGTALAKLMQGALKYAARLLATKQRAGDYKPREDDAAALLDGRPSAACDALQAFVRVQYEAVVTSLDGKNLDKYLTIFGLKLHDVLVAHLQKYTISTMGAGLLARDLKQYQLLMAQFHLAPVLDKWTELRQIIDLFFVGPEYLRAVIQDSSKLSKLDPQYLLSWIQMRADWSDHKRKILASLNLKEHEQTHE